MKVYHRLFLLLVITICSQSLFASHSLGGYIGWNCLPNGKYQFHMSFYRDCAGIPWNYQSETIDITGTPLPTDSLGNAISSIIVYPDSARWKSTNDGVQLLGCTDQYGDTLSCQNGDDGIIQEFFYISTPITLKGVPPTSGWRFHWTAPCCRAGNFDNIFTNGANPRVLLRAEMYPTRDRENANPCIDSSPEFIGPPIATICRGYDFSYNLTVIDQEFDSITFQYERPLDPPAVAPVGLAYKTGYNFNNPTPDKSFDSRNTPMALNRTSGQIKMGVYNGSGVAKYLIVIQATAWRDGVRTSRTYKEWPISVIDCEKLPTGLVNKPPQILVEGKSESNYAIQAVAGQEIRLSLEAKDLDQTGVGSQLQMVSLVPEGALFSRNRKDPLPCPADAPCAVLNNMDPLLDVNENPPTYKIQGLGGLSTEFIWQTDCKHLENKTGTLGTRSAIYNFVMRVADDHCPQPMVNYQTISARVVDPIILTEPIVKGVSIGLDGLATYQWAAPIDSANSFSNYIVELATVPNTFQPSFWGVLNDTLRIFQKQAKDDAYTIYQRIGGNPANGPKLLNPITNFDWYLRMTTVSGCGDTSESFPSEKVRVIELETSYGGIFPAPLKAGTQLSWNRAKHLKAASKPYYIYESPTTFYVWQNDSISNGGVGDSANWYLRGSTQDTTYNAPSNVCGDYVGYRIEARDTIITRKQGEGLNADSLVTLTFSTFSVIDTIWNLYPGILPDPRFDTVQVLANGDVHLTIDVVNAGTTGEFRLYDGSVAGTAIDSLVKKKRLTTTIVGAGATVGTAEQTAISGIAGVIGNTKDYTMKAIDACNPARFTDGQTYSTISPYGGLSKTCPTTFTLNWNQPMGYAPPYGIDFYKIYNKGELIEVVSGTTNTTLDIRLKQGSSYEFQVIAVDKDPNTNREAVNISAVLNYTAPAGFRTDEMVAGPDLRCSFVEQNGSVTLSFDQPLDSTANGTAYQFDYRIAGTANWTTFPQSGLIAYSDSVVTISGINAQWEQCDFRAKTESGCSGTETGDVGELVSSIFLEATPLIGDLDKRGELSWNNDAVAKINPTTIYKYGNSMFYQESILTTVEAGSPYIDSSNISICDSTFNYHISREVPTFKSHTVNGQKSCLSRSNISTANYLDTINPAFDTVYLDKDTLKVKTISRHDSVQWLRCTYNSGLPFYERIDAANYLTYFPNDTGRFAVQIKDQCGNTALSDCIPIFPVGIQEISFQEQINFYPNPTNGKVNLSLQKAVGVLQLQVRNMHGQLLNEQRCVNQKQLEIDIEGEAGIYFLQLTNEEGEQANLKVVKQ